MADAPEALHVVSSDALAGIERHALALISALRRHGCDARLVCRADAEVLRRAAASRQVPLAGGRALARAEGCVVHVHDGRAALAAGVLASRRAMLVRTQHFIATASSGRPGLAGGLSLATHRVINRRYRGQVMVSDAVLSAARERRELGHSRVAVIGAGVELPDAAAVHAAETWRRGHGDPVVIAAGRMEPERRFEVLIRALPRLLARVPACRVIMAGDGSDRRALQALAVELGVAAVIKWPGWVADLADVLVHGHVYVNTWPQEAFGMATAEAMALGLVPLVADRGAAGELIEPGISGVRFGTDEPAVLASVLADLLEAPDQLERMGAAARLRAQRYGIDDVAQRMLAFYDGLAV